MTTYTLVNHNPVEASTVKNGIHLHRLIGELLLSIAHPLVGRNSSRETIESPCFDTMYVKAARPTSFHPEVGTSSTVYKLDRHRQRRDLAVSKNHIYNERLAIELAVHLPIRKRVIAKDKSAKKVVRITIVPTANRACRRRRVPKLITVCELHRAFLEHWSNRIGYAYAPFQCVTTSRTLGTRLGHLRGDEKRPGELAVHRHCLGPVEVFVLGTDGGIVGIGDVGCYDNGWVGVVRS